MARQPTGQVIVRKRKQGKTFSLRFRAYGSRRFVTLGTDKEGRDERKAQDELANILADVRRGTWRSRESEIVTSPPEDPTFHEFASDWFARRTLEGLRPRTVEHLRWVLSHHLLPFFHDRSLRDITAQEIDRYTSFKVEEGKLSNSSINRTVVVLSTVLDLAVEYGHLTVNPAQSRRRRLPTKRPARSHLEPDEVKALIEAAGELDDEDRDGRHYRRPLLATLAYGGLRVGELLALKGRTSTSPMA